MCTRFETVGVSASCVQPRMEVQSTPSSEPRGRVSVQLAAAPTPRAKIPRWLATTRWLPSEGKLITPVPESHIVVEPPPSKLSAQCAPSSSMSCASSAQVRPMRVVVRPSATAT